MIDTIIFDLDATLVPINQELFIKLYMSELAKKATNLGYDKDIIIKGIWAGSLDMLANDGSRKNSEVFWETFAEKCGKDIRKLEPIFDSFYAEEFNFIEEKMSEKRSYRAFFDFLKSKGYTLVLATNPLFPYVASVSRLSWIGLTTDDFAHVTTYDNCKYCKPKMAYFTEVLNKINKKPVQCIMVGNNATDDMCVVEGLGMDAYLVTDHLENPDGVDINKYKHGKMSEFAAYFGYTEKI